MLVVVPRLSYTPLTVRGQTKLHQVELGNEENDHNKTKATLVAVKEQVATMKEQVRSSRR